MSSNRYQTNPLVLGIVNQGLASTDRVRPRYAPLSTYNMHGNAGAYINFNDSDIHGLAAARTHFGQLNKIPPFCTRMNKTRGLTPRHIGGCRPAHIVVSDGGCVQGFLYYYKYDDKHVFFAVHLREGTFIAKWGAPLRFPGCHSYHPWLGVGLGPTGNGYDTAPIAFALTQGEIDHFNEDIVAAVGSDDHDTEKRSNITTDLLRDCELYPSAQVADWRLTKCTCRGG